MRHVKFLVLFVIGLLMVFACLPSAKQVKEVKAAVVTINKPTTQIELNRPIFRPVDKTLLESQDSQLLGQLLKPVSIPTSQAGSTECDTAYTVCSQIWNAVAAVCALETGDLRSCYSRYLQNRAQCVSDSTDGRCTVILH